MIKVTVSNLGHLQ